MNIENLLLHSDELIQHMEDDGYSKSYILLLKTEINWLKKNGNSVGSYEGPVRSDRTKQNQQKCNVDIVWSTES